MAGTGSMTSALTADIYGRFSVSSVFGLIFLVHQTGSALGSSLAGLLFERDRRLRRRPTRWPACSSWAPRSSP